MTLTEPLTLSIFYSLFKDYILSAERILMKILSVERILKKTVFLKTTKN